MKHVSLVPSLLLAGTIACVGCSKNDNPQPQRRAPGTETQNRQGGKGEPSTVDNQKPSSLPTREQLPTTVAGLPPQAPPTTTDKKVPVKKDSNWTDRLDSTRGYIQDRAIALGSVVHPSEESSVRRETLDQARQQSQEVRGQNFQALASEVALTSATPVVSAQAALHPTDEVTTLLANLVSEKDPARIAPTTSQLVDEVFNEPELARAKVMEVQLGLRHLAEHNLYNSDSSKRIAYLQAMLDHRIKSDQNADVLKDAVLIAGSSALVGTAAGFHSGDRIREAIHGFRAPSWNISALPAKLKAAISDSSSRVRSLFSRRVAAETAERVVPARGRLSTEKAVDRYLKALGMSDEKRAGLELTPVADKEAHYQDWKITNEPNFRYAISDQLGGEDLGQDRVLIFQLPFRAGFFRRKPVVSRKMSIAEADEIADSMKFKPLNQGGKEFVALEDVESGEIVPTRMTTDEVSEELPNVTGEVVATEAGPTITQTAKARASEMSERVTGAAKTVVTAASNGLSSARQATGRVAGKVVDTSRRALNDTVDTVKPALKNFDKRWATVATLGSAIPLYGLYYSAYDEGHKHGQDYETVYLESLIPYERINQITVSAQQTEEQP